MAGKGGNYYAVLGVSRSASAEEIRAAFLKLATKWQPDKVGNPQDDRNASRFLKIQEAYKVLSDPGKRARYDRGKYNPTSSDSDDEDYYDDKVMSDDFGELSMGMGMGMRFKKKDDEPAGVPTGGVKQQAAKKKGSSSSSSSPAARVGPSPRAGPASSRPRRRILSAKPKFK